MVKLYEIRDYVIETPLEEVKEGMILGESIERYKKGMRINNFMIEKLNNMGRSHILIRDDYTNSQLIQGKMANEFANILTIDFSRVKINTIEWNIVTRYIKKIIGDKLTPYFNLINEHPENYNKIIENVQSKVLEILKTLKSTEGYEIDSNILDLIFEEFRNPINLAGLLGIYLLEDKEDKLTHSIETMIISIIIAKQLGKDLKTIVKAGLCGLLHDIGYFIVGNKILTKTGRMMQGDWNHIHLHTLVGYHFLSFLEHYKPVTAVVAGIHHEYNNGNGGYGIANKFKAFIDPEIIITEEMKEISRIISVADKFPAIKNPKNYKTLNGINNGREIIEAIFILMEDAENGVIDINLVKALYKHFFSSPESVFQTGMIIEIPYFLKNELYTRYKLNDNRKDKNGDPIKYYLKIVKNGERTIICDIIRYEKEWKETKNDTQLVSSEKTENRNVIIPYEEIFE